MGINVNVSTATTPGLLPVEQPDVTGSWDHPMVLNEVVIGCFNQLTYGDYNEVTIGGYFDVCVGMLLEVVLGATVEVITPLAVEVIFPIPGCQNVLKAIGAGPAMAAASAMGFEGRNAMQGGDQPGLQYDVVFGDYTEWVQELAYTQTGEGTYEYNWVKVFTAQKETKDFPACDAVECSGYGPTGSAGGGTRTLVSEGNTALIADGELNFLGSTTSIVSESNIAVQSYEQLFLTSNTEAVTLSAIESITVQAGTSTLTMNAAGMTINVPAIRCSSVTPAQAGGVFVPSDVVPLAAQIVAQALAAAAAARAWVASAQAEIAAAGTEIPTD